LQSAQLSNYIKIHTHLCIATSLAFYSLCRTLLTVAIFIVTAEVSPTGLRTPNDVRGRMKSGEIVYQPKRHMFFLSPLRYLIYPRSDGTLPLVEKNWSPFLHNNILHYVYNVFPLHVIREGETVGEDSINMSLVSLHHCPQSSLFWEYGAPRGGTPALMINEKTQTYLAFFHSSTYPGVKKVFRRGIPKSYFFGAYTFIAEGSQSSTSSLKFKLLSMSPYPIKLDEWYEGKWLFPSTYIAYVPYPMGFVLREEAGVTYVLLTISTIEKYGHVVKIELDKLLKSLRPIDCSSRNDSRNVSTNNVMKHIDDLRKCKLFLNYSMTRSN
jgi:hypothetical protein